MAIAPFSNRSFSCQLPLTLFFTEFAFCELAGLTHVAFCRVLSRFVVFVAHFRRAPANG